MKVFKYIWDIHMLGLEDIIEPPGLHFISSTHPKSNNSNSNFKRYIISQKLKF